MTATRLQVIALSANDRFKLRYPRTLKAATLAALTLTAVMVWLSPRYVPKPYVLRGNEWFPVDLDVVQPDVATPPRPAPPPPMPRVIEPVGDPALEDSVGLVDIGRIWDPAPPAPPYLGDDGFVASSAKPVLTYYAKPDYPELARHAQLEGTVMIHVLVGVDGRVTDAVVVAGVHPLLDRAAEQAARLCRFKPARQREIPVKAWLAVPFRFTLR